MQLDIKTFKYVLILIPFHLQQFAYCYKQLYYITGYKKFNLHRVQCILIHLYVLWDAMFHECYLPYRKLCKVGLMTVQ